MKLLRILSCLCILALGGCWESKELLLDETKDGGGLYVGTYRDSTGREVRVTPDEIHPWYRVDGRRVRLNSYGRAPNGMLSYAYAAEFDRGYAYGLIFIGADETVYDVRPSCDDPESRKVAKKAYAEVSEHELGYRCTFDNASDLDFALKQLWSRAKVSKDQSYVRVPGSW